MLKEHVYNLTRHQFVCPTCRQRPEATAAWTRWNMQDDRIVLAVPSKGTYTCVGCPLNATCARGERLLHYGGQ